MEYTTLDYSITKTSLFVLIFQAYFITNMEPIRFWEFISLILAGLGYERYIFLASGLKIIKLDILHMIKLGP